MRPEERQLIARLAHGADPREPGYDKERPREVAWSGYVSARRHIDAGRAGEERLAYLIRQIAKVTLRDRRLEGAVVTDRRRVRCLLVQTSDCLLIVKHADHAGAVPELRGMPFEGKWSTKGPTRFSRP